MRHRISRPPHNQPTWPGISAIIQLRQSTSTAVDFSRTYLKQVVAIHQAMFEKLLFA